MASGSYALAFVAGVLSILSPCVLPLLPIVLGSALAAHRFGPPALAAGLALSFVGIGLFVATVGFSLGVDEDVFRIAASVLMLAFGLVLLVPRLQDRITAGASRLAAAGGSGRLASFSPEGVSGQFLLGLLLGAVWSPCVGPTLGAAATLAAGGEALGDVAAVMLAFGVGAALPLLAIGQLLSKGAATRRHAWRSKLLYAGAAGKGLLGAALVLLAIVTFAGWDKRIEAALVARSPDWLTDLTTRY